MTAYRWSIKTFHRVPSSKRKVDRDYVLWCIRPENHNLHAIPVAYGRTRTEAQATERVREWLAEQLDGGSARHDRYTPWAMVRELIKTGQCPQYFKRLAARHHGASEDYPC